MPATMQGPAIFLAQFAGDAAPFNSFASICGWAAKPRIQRRAGSDLGLAGCSIWKRRPDRRLLR